MDVYETGGMEIFVSVLYNIYVKMNQMIMWLYLV